MYNPTFSILQTECVEFVCSVDSTHCTTNHTVALVLQIPYLPPSFFASFLPPCLPLISGECSIVVLSLLVIWFSCYFTMMSLVIAFCTVGASLLYCMCMACLVRWFLYTWSSVPFVSWLVYHYHIVCMYYSSQYTVHGTVVSVHPLYSTQVLFLPSRWCVTSHYSIICMYSSTRRMVR